MSSSGCNAANTHANRTGDEIDCPLLVFPLAELKLQANGGRGLTLMDVDAKDPLISVSACQASVRVLGTGRAGKAKDEIISGVAYSRHQGKRARKGLKIEGAVKVTRVLPS